MDLFSFVTAQFLVSAAVIIVMVHVILGLVAYGVLLERKISAYIQDRIGPNRVGFDFGLPILAPLKGLFGLGQPLADGIKFMLKEDFTPARVDKVLFTLAPMVIVIPALIGFAVIPWGGWVEIPTFTIPIINHVVEGGLVHVTGANVNIGIVYLLAVASLGVYGVTLGGWASNNKYSFLGGLRATAQMISYEIPLGLALLAVLLLVGSVLPDEIIRYQVENGWMIVAQPVAAIIFLIAILAEANRAPFDNAEAEQELVGGYHTEYSSMRFALYFLAEYSHLVTSCAFFTLLFLGGYHIPLVPGLQPDDTWVLAPFLKIGCFLTKVVVLIALSMVVRWTIPRLRYDQIMMTAWQAVIPLALAVVVVTSVMIYFDLGGLLPMLTANGLLAVAFVGLLSVLPSRDPNRRVPMYGSRFMPAAGTTTSTAPSEPMALMDKP
ncbi:MAG: complex I subunit 1 family protein [Planctomycetota bacterium]|nr:complex I subunit 1 family protein [Planctomycetota bacterium]